MVTLPLNVMTHVIENNARFLIRARDEDSKNLLSTIALPASPEFDIDFERWLTRRNTRAVKEQPVIYKIFLHDPLIILENTAVPFIISGSELSVSSFLTVSLRLYLLIFLHMNSI